MTDPLQSTRHETAPTGPVKCDILIVGGTTAAYAAGVVAAKEAPTKRVVLLEPTNWVGGQLTASAVCAVDWAHHSVMIGGKKVGLSDVAALHANLPPGFDDITQRCCAPDKYLQRCWVSRTSYLPQRMLSLLLGMKPGNLDIVYETVITKALHEGRRIKRVEAVTRRARSEALRYKRPPSQDIPDWYSEEDSEHYEKQKREFEGVDDDIVFVDASEWGELMVLAEAEYAIGMEDPDGALNGHQDTGQSTVFDFVEVLRSGSAPPQKDKAPPSQKASSFQFRRAEFFDGGRWNRVREILAATERRAPTDDEVAWHLIWTYRRLVYKAVKGEEIIAHAGDLCLQNWGTGNDYDEAYLFKDKADAKAEIGAWQGGVKYGVMGAAEARALAWHEFFSSKNPVPGTYVDLAKDVLDTKHGLAKLPYIRDTRRSVGAGGFMLTSKALVPERGLKAHRPSDAVAIGCYAFDIHMIKGAKRPDGAPPGLFYIPFRALTNDTFDNLLVAGKTMAQTFLANAATRVHPIEWASGVAAGATAAVMVKCSAKTPLDLYRDNLVAVRVAAQNHTPIKWSDDPSDLAPPHPKPLSHR